MLQTTPDPDLTAAQFILAVVRLRKSVLSGRLLVAASTAASLVAPSLWGDVVLVVLAVGRKGWVNVTVCFRSPIAWG